MPRNNLLCDVMQKAGRCPFVLRLLPVKSIRQATEWQNRETHCDAIDMAEGRPLALWLLPGVALLRCWEACWRRCCERRYMPRHEEAAQRHAHFWQQAITVAKYCWLLKHTHLCSLVAKKNPQ